MRETARQPEWYDELDVAARAVSTVGVHYKEATGQGTENNLPQELAYCFLQAGRLQLGMIDTFTRYETSLWRQAAQLLFILQSRERC